MHSSSETFLEDPSFAPGEIGHETPGINAILQRSRNTQLVLHLAGESLARRSVSVLSPSPAVLLDDLVTALTEIRRTERVDDRLFYPRVERARLNQDAALIGVSTGVLYEALRPVFGLKE
jgi:hypothetical protein